MYVIERGASAWLCTTVIESFEVQVVQIRLRGAMKDFTKFQQSIDNFERINAGVISVYKCSKARKCEDCTKYTECNILRTVQETAQAHAEWVESNHGYTF